MSTDNRFKFNLTFDKCSLSIKFLVGILWKLFGWWRYGIEQVCVKFQYDNQSVANLVIKSRMKHIDITYHFVKIDMYEKMIELVKIDDKFNLTNALTKIISLEKF